ncbi:sce7726 family protein [Luteibacter anthropi]|uniref:sce7726 family protein n=1 Tax=Luteibacter anthropi TaxID=564369 RepID=UPI002032F5AE|nr:sce7726 family protein [Luteibacter anthropi]URX62060.1 sce7726 family protein [Luteibacter anthropi]
MTAATAQPRQLAQMFSRPVLSAMARDGRGEAVRRLVQAAGLDAAGPIGQLFCRARARLERDYRCEYVYKAALVDRIVFGRHRPTTAGIQTELAVDRSIVDLALFNGTSTAYEIKTEFDSARRLSTQTNAYLQAFERVFVVTHPDLTSHYMASTDERVGVLALGARGRLTIVREAIPDMSRLQPSVLFRMLRRDEYLYAVEQVHGTLGELPSGLAFAHCEPLFSALPSDVAHGLVLAAMRRRSTTPELAAFSLALPPSLRLFGLSMRFSGKQRQRLLSALDA